MSDDRLTAEAIRAALAVCEGAEEGPWGAATADDTVPGDVVIKTPADDIIAIVPRRADARYIAATRDPATGWEVSLQALDRCYALADDLTERADSARRGGRHGDAVELLGIARLIRATIEGR